MIRFLTAGESHGKALLGIVEGVPAGLEVSSAYINHQLQRRQQGYGRGTRMKIEHDEVEILSGVRFGITTGAPIALAIYNKDWESKSSDWKHLLAVEGDPPQGYEDLKVSIPRPGHADFVGAVKYRYDDLRNSIERASARETAMRVAIGSIARKLLEMFGIFIGSHVLSIGEAAYRKQNSRIRLAKTLQALLQASCGAYKIAEQADKSEVRIIDEHVAALAISEIKKAKKNGDTLGGMFEVIVSGLPAGLGTYVHWDRRLDGLLGQAILSIPAVKGVEIGEAFENAKRFGSEVHDELFIDDAGKIFRRTNRAGGVEGGVTNGELLILRAAMKPIATLMRPLRSVDLKIRKGVIARRERSDFCAVPAASVIGESVVALVIANAFLEKYGGDSIGEIKEHFQTSKDTLR
ncbi:MAG: chorismate synthase [Bacteroidota bacterium]